MYLEVKDLTVLYDRAMVLNGVNIRVEEEEMISLVGPNGAGKSTLLRAIMGLVKWEIDTLKGTRRGKITLEGSVLFKGEELINLSSHEICRRGFGFCPERGRPFSEMSVKENLRTGAYLVKNKDAIKKSLSVVYDLFPVLKNRQNQISGSLSGGERTMLSIGRALMSQGEVLLIDEPSVGLAPKMKNHLFTRIRNVHELGITIFLVEQDISFAFDLASRNYIMSRGKVVAEGSTSALLADDLIKETYLGI